MKFRSSGGEIDGDEVNLRIKPENIEKLCQMTQFSKKELQFMYRGFKEVNSMSRCYETDLTYYATGMSIRCSEGGHIQDDLRSVLSPRIQYISICSLCLFDL